MHEYHVAHQRKCHQIHTNWITGIKAPLSKTFLQYFHPRPHRPPDDTVLKYHIKLKTAIQEIF